jgi:hypothetical protein
LKLEQEHTFAFEDTSGIRAELIVAYDADILEHQRILIGPWRRQQNTRKQFEGGPVRIIDRA